MRRDKDLKLRTLFLGKFRSLRSVLQYKLSYLERTPLIFIHIKDEYLASCQK